MRLIVAHDQVSLKKEDVLSRPEVISLWTAINSKTGASVTAATWSRD